ncbi:MAG TPA: hypothetical protein PLH37_02525 [bacterium]|nr:hypothetical protein [bacterium]
MTSIYRTILRQALKIMWSCKYLWFFGIFAIFLSSGGEINSAIDNFYKVFDASSFLDGLKTFYNHSAVVNAGNNLNTFFGGFNGWGIILLVVLVLLFFFLIWLTVVSQAGLFGAAYKIYKKQNVNFSDTFAMGRRSFWPAVWLNVLSRLIIYALWLIVAVPLVALYLSRPVETVGNIFIVLTFIIWVPVALFISFLMKYAVLFVVNKKYAFKEAVQAAWQLFRENWLVSIEMAIIMFFVNLLAAIALVLAVMALVLPLAILVFLLGMINFAGVMYLTMLVAVILLVLLMIWGGAMLSVFQHVAWTILFVRMTEGKVLAKIVRLIARRSLPVGEV